MMKPILKGCSRNFKKFFEWSVDYLGKHDKKLIVSNTKYIKSDGIKCSGWCDGEEIVIARKMPKFEETYVHEFSHMNQAVENSRYWFEDNKFWEQLEKQTLQIRSWDEVLKVIALERDCERRAMKHSRDWDLFDDESYAQAANTYLYFYHFVFLKQKWVTSTTIYHPFIVNAMPKKLLPLSEFKSINMELMNLYNECLDRKGKYYKKR